jgi:hypothetical protein
VPAVVLGVPAWRPPPKPSAPGTSPSASTLERPRGRADRAVKRASATPADGESPRQGPFAKREADAKWPRTIPPIIKTELHVKRYTQPVTDKPFLNRVLFSTGSSRFIKTRPRRAGRPLGWPSTGSPRLGRGAGCGIPPTSPRATTRQPRGRATWRTHQFRRGLPLGRRVVGLASGRRDATRTPTCKICDPYPGRRACRETPDRESDVWQQADGRGQSHDRRSSGLHQLVHQRLWTTMDILGRKPKDQARPRTNCRSSLGAAYDYGSDG